ncbi:MAG: EF-hand domain-containing protein [Steroidobacteraceae bacterium]|jgi:hypothetical protein
MYKTVIACLIGALCVTSVGGPVRVARADESTAAASPAQLKSGLSLTAQLLQLMDTNKNGKVSKEEFMRFMEAEFDFADKDKNGELDPKELRRLVFALSHPNKGPGR